MVKARAQITITKVIDIYASYRYYKLQSSVSEKPSKPTTNPPDGWSDTEPSYISGSTNTLYFVDCNVYSDMTFSFSEVSVSSSYEAAKAAWNKAQNAEDTANDVNEKVDKVLRYDDTKVVLGKTGSNMALSLQNDGVSIQKEDDTAASFQSDKLTLGNGYMELGYNEDTRTTYLKSDVQGKMDIYLPATETEDTDAVAGRLRFHSGDVYNSASIESGKASVLVESVNSETYKSTIKLIGEDVYINGDRLDDYIIAQGTSGIWLYRKWASGIAEFFGSAVFAFKTTAGSYTLNSFSFPFDLVSLISKSVWATWISGSKLVYAVSGGWDLWSLTETGKVVIMSDANNFIDTQTGEISYDIKGRWK